VPKVFCTPRTAETQKRYNSVERRTGHRGPVKSEINNQTDKLYEGEEVLGSEALKTSQGGQGG